MLTVVVIAFTGFELAMDSRTATSMFTNIPWERSVWGLAVLFTCLGAAAFFVFRSYWPWRLALVTAIPVLAQLILELTVGSNPAYPGLTLALAIPYGALFFSGGVVVALPYWFVRRSHDKAI